MSESNHNQSFEDGDTNDFQGSPSSSRASSPAPSSPPPSYTAPSHIQPYSPNFSSSEQHCPPHIKSEPKNDDFVPPENGYAHHNFFANFLEKRFQTMDPSKPSLVQKPVPLFSPHLPAFLREKLEAAVTLPNSIYPGFPPHPSLFQAHPNFHFPHFNHHLTESRTNSEQDGQANNPEVKASVNNSSEPDEKD